METLDHLPLKGKLGLQSLGKPQTHNTFPEVSQAVPKELLSHSDLSPPHLPSPLPSLTGTWGQQCRLADGGQEV